MWIQGTVGLWRWGNHRPQVHQGCQKIWRQIFGSVEEMWRWLKPRNKAPAREHQPCGVCTAMSLTTSGRMMNLVDATCLDQTLWMATFLVTKTISNKEVWEPLPGWEASIKAEYDQLVNHKTAVIQVTQKQLRDKQLKPELRLSSYRARWSTREKLSLERAAVGLSSAGTMPRQRSRMSTQVALIALKCGRH